MRDKTKPFLASAPRIVLVDGTSAASPFPSTAHVVTDVTEKAHFSVDIRFWQDKNLHPDASFSFPRIELSPGDVFDVPGCPFVAGACCRDGLASWRAICTRLRKNIP